MPESETPKSETGNDGGTAAQPVSAGQVATYLRKHPDFLTDYPDLMDVLTPPTRDRGEGVVDLQHFMVERLRREIANLTQLRDELVATGRSNLATQSRVHQAILALLRAGSFEEFVETTTTDLAVILDLDVVTIGVEQAAQGAAWKPIAGVYCLEAGSVDALLGPGGNMLLRDDITGNPAIFSGGAGLVRSDALIRLSISETTPPALLALGSRQEGAFHTGQATELLSFLSQALEVTFRAWLNLPSEN